MELTLEPFAAVVVAVLLETEVLGLVVDANLGFVLEEVRHGREARGARGSANAQSPIVPTTIIRQFLDGTGPGFYRAFQ